MMIQIYKDQKWGYYNSLNGTTIPCIYSEIEDFIGSFAIVKLEYDKYGVIDTKGDIIILQEFSRIERLGNNHFKAVKSDGFSCYYNSKGHIVRKDGSSLPAALKPYSQVEHILDNIYIVRENDCYFLHNGIEKIRTFENGYPCPSIIDGPYFLLKKQSSLYKKGGKLLIKNIDDAEFCDNLYFIVHRNYKYGVYDINGKVILKELYKHIEYRGKGCFYLVYTDDKKEGKHESVFFDSSNKSFSVEDDEGKPCNTFGKFDWISNFSNGYAIIAINHKYGCIDKDNIQCLECIYDEIKFIDSHLAIVYKEKKCALVNIVNKSISAEFESIRPLGHNLFVIKKGSSYGVIDSNYNEIVKPHFDENIIYYPDNNTFEVCMRFHRGGQKYIVNKNSQMLVQTSKGDFALPNDIIWISEFTNGFAFVENEKNLIGVINDVCDLIIPCIIEGDPSFINNEIIEIKRGNSISGFYPKYYINLSGYFVVKPSGSDLYVSTNISIQSKFDIVCSSINNICRFYDKSKWKWGLCNHFGEIIVEPFFDSIGIISDRFFLTCIGKGYMGWGNKYGILDRNGKEILACKYPNIKLINDETFEIVLKTDQYTAKPLERLFINTNRELVVSNGDEKVFLPLEYDYVKPFINGYACYRIDGLWGLIDTNKNVVLECKYQHIGIVNNGHVYCRLDGRKLMANIETSETIELPDCETATFHGNNCILIGTTFPNKNSNRFRLLNNKSESLTKEFAEFKLCSNKYFIVAESHYPNWKYGVISMTGQQLIPCEYEYISYIESQDIFKVSKKISNYGNEKKPLDPYYIDVANNKLVLDDDNYMLLPSKYLGARKFKEGLAAVYKEVQETIQENDELIDDNLDYLFGVAPPPKEKRNYPFVWGFIDINGNEIIECKFDNVSDFKYGLSIVRLFDKCGVINKHGEFIIDPQYDEMDWLDKNHLKIAINDDWGYDCWGVIDINGNSIVPCHFVQIGNMSDNIIAIKEAGPNSEDEFRPDPYLFPGIHIKPVKKGLWGFINIVNNTKITAQYDDTLGFSEGLAAVQDKKGWKYINDKGVVVIDCSGSESIDCFNKGVANITFKSDKSTIKQKILKNGNLLVSGVELSFDLAKTSFIGKFVDGIAKFCINNKWGYINTKGDIILDGVDVEVDDFCDGHAFYYHNDFGKNCINKDGKTIVDINGIIKIFPNDICAARMIHNGLYEIMRKEDTKKAFINDDFKLIIPFTEKPIEVIYEGHFDSEPKNYIKVIESLLFCNDESVALYYDFNGNRIIPNSNKHIIISQNYGVTSMEYSSGLVAVSKNGLWGFLDENGNEVISCSFYEVEKFVDNYCCVRDEYNKLGLINKKGNMIMPYRDYSSIGEYFCGYAEVCHASYGHEEKWGDEYDEREWIPDKRTINENGEIVLIYDNRVALPKEYEWCSEYFSDGYLSVRMNGKWGIINRNFELLIPCIYDKEIIFKDGIAIAEINNTKYIIDNSCVIRFFGEYSSVVRYKEAKIFVCLSKDETYYDIYGENGIFAFSTLEMKPRRITPDEKTPSINKFSISNIIPLDNNYLKYYTKFKLGFREIIKCGLCDMKGVIILNANFEDICGVGNGLIAVANSIVHGRLKWGYCDMNGNIKIELKYSKATPFIHGTAKVKNEYDDYNSKWALISTSGEELTEFIYDNIIIDDKGILVSNSNGSHKNTMNRNGKIQIDYYESSNDPYDPGYELTTYLTGYDWCSEINNKHCIVWKGKQQGIINQNGTETCKLLDRGDIRIDFDDKGNLIYRKLNKSKLITTEGQIITSHNGSRFLLPAEVQWCEEWCGNIIAIMIDGKWGVYSKHRYFILDPIYDQIQCIDGVHILCVTNKNEGKNSKSLSIYNIKSHSYIDLPYDTCSDFKNGVAIVSRVIKEEKTYSGSIRKESLYGIIDLGGHELLPCVYTDIQFEKPPKIERSFGSYDDYEEPDYARDTWDALTDGMYGDYPGPGIDYDIFGF